MHWYEWLLWAVVLYCIFSPPKYDIAIILKEYTMWQAKRWHDKIK